MTTAFRHADPRFPFLWDSAAQPAARWHDHGEGPVNYFADTPYGAWAELLRHEGIRTRAELATVRRALWAVELDEPAGTPALPPAVMTGGDATYAACRAAARALRDAGEAGLVAPSAALLPGEARGSVVVRGKRRRAKARDGRVIARFGPPDGIEGWCVVSRGRPPPSILKRVRHL